MATILRPLTSYPWRGLGSAVLRGVVEFLALARSRWATRRRRAR